MKLIVNEAGKWNWEHGGFQGLSYCDSELEARQDFRYIMNLLKKAPIIVGKMNWDTTEAYLTIREEIYPELHYRVDVVVQGYIVATGAFSNLEDALAKAMRLISSGEER